MGIRTLLLATLFCSSFFGLAELSQASVFLMPNGGKTRPIEAIRAIARQANYGTILVICHNSEIPIEVCADLEREFKSVGVKRVLRATKRPGEYDRVGEQAILNQLALADGIYLSGGNQNLGMSVFKNHPRILNKILEMRNRGIPIGGTSAGTAQMSKIMLTGKDAETAPGMALIENVIFEQHFNRPGRWERVHEVLQKTGVPVIAIEEDTSLEIIDFKIARVWGQRSVFIFKKVNGKIIKFEYKNGDTIPLSTILPDCSRSLNNSI